MPITESYAGRVFEVNRAGEIVWSWVNHVGEQDGKPIGGVVGGTSRSPPGRACGGANDPASSTRPARPIDATVLVCPRYPANGLIDRQPYLVS